MGGGVLTCFLCLVVLAAGSEGCLKKASFFLFYRGRVSRFLFVILLNSGKNVEAGLSLKLFYTKKSVDLWKKKNTCTRRPCENVKRVVKLKVVLHEKEFDTYATRT